MIVVFKYNWQLFESPFWSFPVYSKIVDGCKIVNNYPGPGTLLSSDHENSYGEWRNNRVARRAKCHGPPAERGTGPREPQA